MIAFDPVEAAFIRLLRKIAHWCELIATQTAIALWLHGVRRRSAGVTATWDQRKAVTGSGDLWHRISFDDTSSVNPVCLQFFVQVQTASVNACISVFPLAKIEYCFISNFARKPTAHVKFCLNTVCCFGTQMESSSPHKQSGVTPVTSSYAWLRPVTHIVVHNRSPPRGS